MKIESRIIKQDNSKGLKMHFNKLFIIAIVGAALLFPGCDHDECGYSLNRVWVTTATIDTAQASPFVIITDGGDRLFPSASAVPWFRVRDGQRVWVSYTILDDAHGNIDYLVRVNDLSEILTKGILTLTPANADSIGHDPVIIRDYWFTGDYLTIRFLYGGGGVIHYINLVQDVNNPVNENGIPILEFRHNRNNDPYNFRMRGTVSFNLTSLRVDGVNSVEFVLRARNFEGELDFERILRYTYGQ